MKITPRTLAAKNIKAALARLFPGTSFSVRSSTFANGDDVRVVWEGGPTVEDVSPYARRYEEGTFNGMTDSYELDRDPEREAFRTLMGHVKYVTLIRKRPQRNTA